VKRAEKALADAQGRGEIDFATISCGHHVCKVSIVGIGMRSHAGRGGADVPALRDEGINIKVITTSEIKVSVLIDRKYMELAVQALHDAFGLERAG
jgi:aspartate kinase